MNLWPFFPLPHRKKNYHHQPPKRSRCCCSGGRRIAHQTLPLLPHRLPLGCIPNAPATAAQMAEELPTKLSRCCTVGRMVSVQCLTLPLLLLLWLQNCAPNAPVAATQIAAGLHSKRSRYCCSDGRKITLQTLPLLHCWPHGFRAMPYATAAAAQVAAELPIKRSRCCCFW